MCAKKTEADKVATGRPSKYKEEYNDLARKFCLLGATDADLAEFFDVEEQTINNWKNAHPLFFESIKKGKAQADANVADRLYQRAMGFEHDEEEIKTVTIAGGGSEIVRVPTRKIYAPDPTSAIFWLKNRQPKKWRDKQELGMTDGDGKDVPAVTVFRIPDNGRSNND